MVKVTTNTIAINLGSEETSNGLAADEGLHASKTNELEKGTIDDDHPNVCWKESTRPSPLAPVVKLECPSNRSIKCCLDDLKVFSCSKLLFYFIS